MGPQTPGARIRGIREQRRISQASLGEAVDLSARTINRIEAGTIPIGTVERSKLEKIAITLGVTAEHIIHGEMTSEQLTRNELLRMRREGLIRSDDELRRLEELAIQSIRQRNNARIPLTRVELLALAEVVRGTDGY